MTTEVTKQNKTLWNGYYFSSSRYEDGRVFVDYVRKGTHRSRWKINGGIVKDVETAVKYYKYWQKQIIEKVNARKERAAKKKADRERLGNPFKVGEILYDSWGYEQTNIEFYQILKVTKATVTVKRIASKIVEQTGWASNNVVAVKDAFLDDSAFRGGEKVKRIRVYGDTAYAGDLYKWDGQPKYESHYA